MAGLSCSRTWSGFSIGFDADKINGLTATGNNIINAGVSKAEMEMIVSVYGSRWGLWSLISDGTNNINGGIFSGGTAVPD